MAEKIRWLHVSDFHIGKDGYGQAMNFQYIIDHVKQQPKPDMIFVTGDIAQAGLSAQYKTFNEQFIQPMKQLVGDDVRWYLVPGNHDVDRDKIESLNRDFVLSKKHDYFEPTAKGLSKRKNSSILSGLQAYQKQIEDPESGWVHKEQGFFTHITSLYGVQVGILGINTAWLSMDENDKEKLTPGRSMVEQGLLNIKDCAVRIVLGHHPFSWFCDAEREPIKAMFESNHVLYLHGHLHKNWAERGGEFLTLQAGAAFQAREHDLWKNRILWGELNLPAGQVEMSPYSWSGDHHTWTVDSDAYHPKYKMQGRDSWAFDLPGARTPDLRQTQVENLSAHAQHGETLTDEQVKTVWLPQLAALYNEEQKAHALLSSVDFPKAHIPRFTSGEAFWQQVAEDIKNGRIEGFEALFAQVAKHYPHGAFKQWAVSGDIKKKV